MIDTLTYVKTFVACDVSAVAAAVIMVTFSFMATVTMATVTMVMVSSATFPVSSKALCQCHDKEYPANSFNNHVCVV